MALEPCLAWGPALAESRAVLPFLVGHQRLRNLGHARSFPVVAARQLWQNPYGNNTEGFFIYLSILE